MKILIAGPVTDTEIQDKLRELGHTVCTPERDVSGRVDVGELMRWMCVSADAVYLMPGWRSCLVARAARGTMLAAGGTVLGFE